MLQLTSPLVSVDWLYKNINAKNLIIFDVTIPKVGHSTAKIQEKEQIPNAIFFDIKNNFSDKQSKYPNTLLHPDEFEFQAQNIGVNQDSCVIVYDDLGIYSSPRVWWMFNVFGFTNIAVLNGGLPAWKKANLYTEKPQEKNKKKGNFISHYKPNNIRFTEDVLSSLISTCIVDARSKNRFLATESEPRKEVRSGHIPNSINIPYTDLLDNGKMKPIKELQSIFGKVNPDKKEMIFSCGSGITACILALGAELVNFKNYAVYDGSWSEWGSRTDLPIENFKNSSWSRKEFEAYILLYCAHSNFIETVEERDYILAKIDEKLFNRIHIEIVHDSKIESEEKIQEYIAENSISDEEKRFLLKDIKSVFFADGSIDKYEKHIFKLLQELLK